MASLIPGFEYDIFISYRQKDNKGDRWVSEFVEALRTELESTFKEEISVYFDINPHDGLLETHDVDASLKEKLKCAVFIPIISRTYCDPKSFAWVHEFKAFIEQASQDQYGLKVKLTDGNIANRVLPVQIHELDADDKKLVESELGGFLRGIEFIYKEPGVNRPLTPNDDENKNLNGTKYKNQINKVANAIKEIITGLRNPQRKEKVKIEETAGNLGPRKNRRIKIFSGTLIVLALIVAGYFIIAKVIKPKEQIEKSIAVLPFINDSPDQENAYFINGIMEEVLNNLQKIKDFRVLSRTSTEQYRGTTRPSIPKIGKALDVNYIVEGSGQKYGNKFILRVQLIAVNNERHLWAKSFEKEIQATSDQIYIQSEIAQSIAAELKVIITPEEKQLIEKIPTTNLIAYDFYQRGRDEHTKYLTDVSNKTALEQAEVFYRKALKNDSTFAQAYTGLAGVLWGKQSNLEYTSQNYMDSVLVYANIALSYDDQSAEAYSLRGDYYRERAESKKALEEYEKATEINPNYWQAYVGKAFTYFMLTWDYGTALENSELAIRLIRGPELPGALITLGSEYSVFGFLGKAKSCFDEALRLNGDSASYFNSMVWIEESQENYREAIEFANRSFALDSTQNELLSTMGACYMFIGQKETALEYYKKYTSRSEDYTTKIWLMERTHLMKEVHRIGYCYWITGNKEEAEKYFNKQKSICEEAIRLKRGGYGPEAYYDLAGIYAIRGEKEKAYENLHLYLKENGENSAYAMVWFFKNDPFFDSIRNEPEFQAIYSDAKAKYEIAYEKLKKYLEEKGML